MRPNGYDFVGWYNDEHHRIGLGLMTPHDIHHGLAQEEWHRCQNALITAYAAHPERYPRGVPTPPPLPTAVWINKPSSTATPVEPADLQTPIGPQGGHAHGHTPTALAAIADHLTTEGAAR